MLLFIKKKKSKEIFTEERCHITELLNDKNCKLMSMARCRVEPGVTTQLHALKGVQETYHIEIGEGIMDDGRSDGVKVVCGDNVVILPGEAQRIYNSGKTDLVFLAICLPRFVPECYINLEDDLE